MVDIKAIPCVICESQPEDCMGYDFHKVRCSNHHCLLSTIPMNASVWTDHYKESGLYKENAQLKADKAELVEMLNFLGDTSDMRSDIYAAVKELVHKELVQKHKEPNNGN